MGTPAERRFAPTDLSRSDYLAIEETTRIVAVHYWVAHRAGTRWQYSLSKRPSRQPIPILCRMSDLPLALTMELMKVSC